MCRCLCCAEYIFLEYENCKTEPFCMWGSSTDLKACTITLPTLREECFPLRILCMWAQQVKPDKSSLTLGHFWKTVKMRWILRASGYCCAIKYDSIINLPVTNKFLRTLPVPFWFFWHWHRTSQRVCFPRWLTGDYCLSMPRLQSRSQESLQ